MSQRVKVHVGKPNDTSSIPNAHIEEPVNLNSRKRSSVLCTGDIAHAWAHSQHTRIYTCTHITNK